MEVFSSSASFLFVGHWSNTFSCSLKFLIVLLAISSVLWSDCERVRSPVSSLSVDSIPSNLNRTGPQNIRCNLSFEDETPGKRSPGARYQSPLPDELGEMTDSDTISQQLMILSKLRFRKLFLVLSYIGRQKLEAVVNLDAANEIYGMKNLPMKDFEAKIWNSYGKKFCEESDRSQYLDWDSQKTHHYYCHVCRDGSYYFKGPYLNSFRTHLQRSLGDDNILIVKFLEDDSNTMGGSVVEEGILVGLRRYCFFASCFAEDCESCIYSKESQFLFFTPAKPLTKHMADNLRYYG
ncbi:UNVERIFIED_CONTAM: putative RNA-dependent RNA polymerase 3 [Sesamum radiatum]|uniref:RNA-dependent RNA polymerase 3 n=1 Tax=Sesamum radiatum TaxID=300843 RepID=A0AAW2LAN4_SESRA